MAASSKKLEQDARVEKVAKKLITEAVSLKEGSENFKRSLQFLLSNFKYHRYLDVNSHNVEKTLSGLYEKFEVHSQSKKADRLQELVNTFLECPMGRKPGLPKTDNHYAILSVLLNLSETPTTSRVEDVAVPQPEEEQDQFDWTSYLLSDLPPLKRFSDDFPSDEEWSEEDEESEADMHPGVTGEDGRDEESTVSECKMRLHGLQDQVVNQYWKDDKKVFVSSGRRAGEIPHDWLASQRRIFSVDQSDVIESSYPLTEDQVVRETLWLFMEPTNGFVYFVKDDKIVHKDGILVSHLSQQTLDNLLDEFTEVGDMLFNLQSFIDASCLPHTPNEAVEDIDRSHLKWCITGQAFADAIRDFLQDFRKEILQLEKRCVSQESVFTLSTLRDTLQDRFYQIRVVYKVYDRCEVSKVVDSSCSLVQRLISELEYSLSTHIQLSSTNLVTARILVVIWMKTMRPYLNFLDHWLTNGTPSNPTGEFVFHRDTSVSVQSDSYWTNSFFIPLEESRSDARSERTNPDAATSVETSPVAFENLPLFLKPIYKQIFEAGKAMELLHAMGYYVTDFVARQPGFTLYSDFQEAILKLLNHYHDDGSSSEDQEETAADPPVDPSSRTSSSLWTDQIHSVDPLYAEAFRNVVSPLRETEQVLAKNADSESLKLPDDAFIPPLEILLHRGLHPLISDLCSQINRRFLEVLKEKHHLFKYLSDLKKYFLLEAGDILNDFYSNLFDDLAGREIMTDGLFENLLNWKLQDTLRTRWSEDAERLFIIIESKDIPVQGGLFFNCMRLDYKVPWPINLLITPSCQEKYNKIFQFLLSVKRVKYCLEQINFKAQLRTNQEAQSNDVRDDAARRGGSTDAITVNEPLLHQLYILRFRLLQFVSAIHDYLMTRILHTTSLEFRDALSSAESLDELISIHDKYLSTISERCLLHPKLSMIREAVVKVLNVAMKYHRKWLLGRHTFSLESLAAMNKEFSNCSFFLSNTLHTVTKKGSFPHLESLSVTIGTHEPPTDSQKRR